MEDNPEIYLELDFEADSSSISDSSSEEESDIDDGELGEYEDTNNAEIENVPVAAAALAYQHEPLPALPNDADEQEENLGDTRPRGNLDQTRLDPNNTDWCKCGGFCQVLPSFDVGDCICYREIEELQTEADAQDSLCITQAPSFAAAILDPIVLFIAWQHFTERWRRQARSFEGRNNEKYRYVAYRQFVRWIWGILGKDIRVQLPACVQSTIKNEYPDGAGAYKGTILRRLDIN